MGDDEQYVDPAVTHGVRDEFSRLGIELGDAVDPVRRQCAQVHDGAGELADALGPGLATFELSWAAALETSSKTAGNLAANVGGMTLDLQALDLDLSGPANPTIR